jgi:hypothetical protein
MSISSRQSERYNQGVIITIYAEQQLIEKAFVRIGELKMSRFRSIAVLSVALGLSTAMWADFSYQQTTQITGGSLLQMVKSLGAFSSSARKIGDPQLSTIYLKGNRMATVTAESIVIYDLDKETITRVDLQKHTWYTMTFEQMRQNMKKLRAKMEKHTATKSAPTAPTAEVSFDVKVRNTGAKKTVSGLPTAEAILSMAMNAINTSTKQAGILAITNDMWMTPEISGYSELRAFQMRMAKKIAVNTASGMDLNRMLVQNPGAVQAMADLAKEMQRLKGIPVFQIMRMGSTTDGKPIPAASEAPLPANNGSQAPSGGEMAKQGAGSVLSSALPFSGMGGFGRKKKIDDQAANQDQGANSAGKNQNVGPSILMETQTTLSSFSSAPVDTSHFDVPTGFKQINAPDAAF